jgi:hypothetical protein
MRQGSVGSYFGHCFLFVNTLSAILEQLLGPMTGLVRRRFFLWYRYLLLACSCHFDCLAVSPIVTHVEPTNTSTRGNILTSFFGQYFGSAQSDISITTNNQNWTGVVWKNSTCVTALSPPGTGKSHPVHIVVDGSSSEQNNALFSYQPPVISSIIAPPFQGGTLRIYGTDFGNEKEFVNIQVDEVGGCARTCAGIEFVSTNGTGVQCRYDGAGSAGANRTTVITINGQNSNTAQFQYDYNRGEMTGIPSGDQRVFEKTSLSYSIGLTKHVVPTAAVTVTLVATSSKTMYPCTVTPETIVFNLTSENGVTPVHVETSGNSKDEGTNVAMATCTIEHSIATGDPQYAMSPSRTVTLYVINDDEADVKLWSIDPINMSYGYDVKFIGPLCNQENGSTLYGVGIDTEPTSPVIVRPQISLDNAHLFPSPPPGLKVIPESFVFNADNWRTKQIAELRSVDDDIDHNMARFRVNHTVETGDAIFAEKVRAKDRDIIAVVDSIDNDAAGIELLSNNLLVLNVGEAPVNITLSRLTSLPLHDVMFYLDVPESFASFITIKPAAPITVKKELWASIHVGLQLQAQIGCPSGTLPIRLRPASLDPKYNSSTIGVDLNVIVQSTSDDPETNITRSPAPVSAEQQRVEFTLFSSCSNLKQFQWRLDAGEYQDSSCGTNARSCVVLIPFVEFGTHRFEARAVSTTNRFDQSPASFEWEITHCNDANRVPQQYAKIEADGAIQCIDCPHPEGANCKTQDAQWEDVFANKGWWTPGRKKNDHDDVNYYKCPFKNACLGGNVTKTIDNGTIWTNTTKSRCGPGYKGLVCAVCDDGFYLLDDQCWVCLPSDGGAETVVALIVFAAVGLFLGALLTQLRVRDSKSYWKELRVDILSGKHKKRNAGNKLEKEAGTANKLQEEEEEAEAVVGTVVDTSRYLKDQNTGRAMKTFIGFVQVLSVSDSAFKIPWPSGFLSFLRILVPFNFDVLSFSGIGCLVEYNFYHSFLGMALLPLVVLFLVYLTYHINLVRHKKIYDGTFTHAMGVAYANRAIQFTLWSILFVYPPLSRRVAEYFACSAKIEGHSYLIKDYRMQCFAGDWYYFLPVGILAMIVYPLGIPAYFAYILRKHRHELKNDIIVARYGFLFEAYVPSQYLWDVFELLRKFVLTGLIIILWPGESFQVIVAVMINLLCLIVILIERPHKPGPGRKLATLTYTGILVTMMIGLILNSVEGATDYHLFLDLVLIGTNLYVVGYTMYILLRPLCLSIGWIKKKKVKVTPHKHMSREKTVNMLFHRSPRQGNRGVG